MQVSEKEQAGNNAIRLMEAVNEGYKILRICDRHNSKVEHPLQKKMLTDQQMHDMTTQVVQKTAKEHPWLAVAFCKQILPFIHVDSRSFDFLLYFGCALFWAGEHRNALAVWHCAAKSPPSTQTDSKMTNDPSKQTEGRHMHWQLLKNAFFVPGIHSQPASLGPILPAANVFDVMRDGTWKSPKHLPTDYHIFNPSIIRHPQHPTTKFLVNLRAADYYIMKFPGEDRPSYRTAKGAEHKVIRTINYLTTIDQQWQGDTFKPKDVVSLKANVLMPYPRDNIMGFEDIRLVWNSQDKTLWGCFTTLEMTPDRCQQIGVGRINLETCSFFPRSIRVLKSPRGDGQIEKNWMVFEYKGQLYWIYSCDPMIAVITTKLEDSKLALQKDDDDSRPFTADPNPLTTHIVSLDMCPLRNAWRGSSPLLKLSEATMMKSEILKSRHQPGDQWYLALVHLSNWPKYAEQFVVFRLRPTPHDMNRPFSMQILACSPVFVFRSHNIEFSCGLEFKDNEETLVLPYSINDQDCACMWIRTDSVWKSLRSIDSSDDMTLSKWIREQQQS